MSTTYNSKLVDSLKQFIPSGSRSFDPQTKFWHITEQYGDFVRQICESAFGVGFVSYTSRTVTQQSQQAMPTMSTNDAVLAFFELIPYEAAKRAYLMASNILHPDKPTGDGAKMSKLNHLWARLEKEFFKR